jgi:hypothetical protein
MAKDYELASAVVLHLIASTNMWLSITTAHEMSTYVCRSIRLCCVCGHCSGGSARGCGEPQHRARSAACLAAQWSADNGTWLLACHRPALSFLKANILQCSMQLKDQSSEQKRKTRTESVLPCHRWRGDGAHSCPRHVPLSCRS